MSPTTLTKCTRCGDVRRIEIPEDPSTTVHCRDQKCNGRMASHIGS